MTNENNSTSELIGIPTPDGVKNIHPDVLKQFKSDCFEWLRKETGAKAEIKQLGEDLEEATGIKKGILIKWAKARYKDETKKTKDLAEQFEALDEAVPEPAGF